jgi:hypothetical protein
MTLLIRTPQAPLDHDLSTRITAAPSTSPNILRNRDSSNRDSSIRTGVDEPPNRSREESKTGSAQAVSRIPPRGMWTQSDRQNIHRKISAVPQLESPAPSPAMIADNLFASCLPVLRPMKHALILRHQRTAPFNL